MNPISWQVSLVITLDFTKLVFFLLMFSQPVGFRFFLSLTSSDGSMWANGPMRVGGLGSSDCFVPGSVYVYSLFLVYSENTF